MLDSSPLHKHASIFMKIHQFYTHNELRNFTYIIELDSGEAIVIDPWDESVIEQELSSRQLRLKAIINTHEHWDHTRGNEALIESHQCEVWAHSNGQGKIPGLSKTLSAGEKIQLESESSLLVLDTPGHTFAHLCFLVVECQRPKAVFTGDTLFNAGVGHCRSGNDEVLYKTISEQFQTMDDDIIVLPGHDYLENNLRFTLQFEPHNQQALAWLEKVHSPDYNPGDVRTTIGDEKSFNTFLRLDSIDIRQSLNLPEEVDAKKVFLTLRARRDNW
jgi:hydroxyacylglutathione hydrolase